MSGDYSQDSQENPGFFQTDYNYAQPQMPPQSHGYEMPAGQEQFPQDPQFQQFDYSQTGGVYPDTSGGVYPDTSAADQCYSPPSPAAAGYIGSIMTPDPVATFTAPAGDNFDDELPLMEELGINFDHIRHKTLAVLNPLKAADTSVMQDTDLAGPLVFCLAFGASLLLSGKVHFGYIYGIGTVGCVTMYALLNLMAITSVSGACTVSVLGYCLLPMVLLSATSIVLSLQGIVGIVLTGLSVLWCSLSASKLFVAALSMDHQQLLVAYPCALVYGVFALLTVF